MNWLHNFEYAPVTFAMVFFEVDLDVLSPAYLKLASAEGAKVSPVFGSIASLLNMMQPVTTPATKTLLVETKSKWTAIFRNNLHEADLIYGISSMLGSIEYAATQRRVVVEGPEAHKTRSTNVRVVRAICRPHTFKSMRPTDGEKGIYLETCFCLYDRFEGAIRYIHVLNEFGPWKIHTLGDVLPFEQTDRYSQRLIKDRLLPEMVDQYCRAVGVNAFDSEFYGERGILVEERQARITQSLSLREAQSEMGLA